MELADLVNSIFVFFFYLQHLNFDHTVVPRGITYYDKKIRIDRNPIRTALNVCKQLISKRVGSTNAGMFNPME